MKKGRRKKRRKREKVGEGWRWGKERRGRVGEDGEERGGGGGREVERKSRGQRLLLETKRKQGFQKDDTAILTEVHIFHICGFLPTSSTSRKSFGRAIGFTRRETQLPVGSWVTCFLPLLQIFTLPGSSLKHPHWLDNTIITALCICTSLGEPRAESNAFSAPKND